MSASVKYWKQRYHQIIQKRERLWVLLEDPSFDRNWLSTRLTEHQWSIDEVFRHILGSEIRYIQQPLDDSIKQHPSAVAAQWVGNIFFRFGEDEHLELDKLILTFEEVQRKSLELFETLNEDSLQQIVEAPWREKVTYERLIEHGIDHELSHLGQIYFMLTNFRGPPKFESNWFDNE